MKNSFRSFFSVLFVFPILWVFLSPVHSQTAVNDPVVNAVTVPAAAGAATSSGEFVKQAWAASSQGDEEKLFKIVAECLTAYDAQARQQQAALANFPDRGKERDYEALNDVGTVLFVKAEFLMNHGRNQESTAVFQTIIKEYKWAQAWDPSRGAFWSVAEKSQASIDVMSGKWEEEEEKVQPTAFKSLPKLHFPGKEQIVDYRKYGQFVGVGTQDYRYEVTDAKGLSEAVGEGIYPNTSGVLKDPNYKKAKNEGRLEGSHWDFVFSDDLEAAFYKWAMAPEPQGVKLFYLARIFERAGLQYEALKAYQALIVHFPETVAKTYWQTPWYPAQAAVAEIKHMVRVRSEMDLEVKWMKIEIRNGFDNDVNNDVFVTYPGVIKKKTWWDKLVEKYFPPQRNMELKKIKKVLGKGEVRLVQYENGHWQMLVKGEPYVIHGMNYSPTKIGQSPDKNTLVAWWEEDSNKNGLPDGPFDSWVDKNLNNQQDADEPTVGDFALMKAMGVNTIREYYQPFKPSKEIFRKMFEQYGIRVAMGNFLGKYTLGSGASWFEGTDYENPTHQKNMMQSVREMVMEFKDEPYLLMWVLGNENNYGVASNADKKPEAYYKFVNEVARMIKSIDPNHPVAICNGDTLFLDIFARYAPDVDIFGSNLYRGDYGFGSFWADVFDATGKPAMITEYGAPAYAKHLTREQGEEDQANYLRGCLHDIEANFGGNKEGSGNSLGGFAFEWVDEWWKNYEPFRHDRKSDAIGPFPGGYYYEEWFGITGQGKGTKSPFLRQFRKAYFTYQEMWNKKK